MKKLSMKSVFSILSITIFSSILSAFVNVPPAKATTAGFDPGRIIDDAVFTNKNSMSVQQIQNFLNSKVATCDTYHADLRDPNPNRDPTDKAPWTCLKDWVGPDYNGVTKSSAQIIYDASQLFSINPQVLIVTLQKEQGLVTDTWPYYYQYKVAMGFGCPDNGGTCDETFKGFGKQVYQAARHFRNFYDENPNWAVPYKVGTRYIKWRDDVKNQSTGVYENICGGTNVNILTHGTAALYNYTPYQPNAASLAAGYGTGDSCSSYGNRNFYNYFTDWFGTTLAYAYQFVSATNPPSTMQPGQQVTITVVLKNTGGQTWGNESNQPSTPARLFTTNPTDHINAFSSQGTGWAGGGSRMVMQTSSVAPGQTGSFVFTYKASNVPGTYVEGFALTIENVVKLPDVGMSFTTTVARTYTYDFVSATNPPATMTAGQTVSASVVLKNTSNIAWGNDSSDANTPVRLYTTNPADHANPFGGGNGWVGKTRMKMTTPSVPIGSNGTFTFDWTAPTTPGSYTEHFAPTAENYAKMADIGLAFPVTVIPAYDYDFVSATNPPATMIPGQTASVSVVLKNTGGTMWQNESQTSSTPMRLFTAHANDHANPFGGGSGWVGKTRMTMATASVATGQNGTFTFDWTAPTTAGTYQEFFAPTVENVIKMKDLGLAFTVKVAPPYDYDFVSATNPPSTMTKGQTVSVTVVLKNTGSQTWGNESQSPSTPMRLFTTHANDHANPFGGGNGWVGMTRMTMTTASVAPGQNGTFSFDWKAPTTLGSYQEFFAPTVENVVKMKDLGLAFSVNVQ